MLIEYHRTMLADRVRNDAFAAALKQLIKPGETVVADVGAGTGLLGFIAAKLGAREVYLYESASIMMVARQLARDNRLKNVYFFEGHSTAIKKPPPVDIIVSETLGNYAFEENIIATTEDAKRFLKPGGIMLPQAVEQFVAPVTNAGFYNELTAPWESVGHNLNFNFAKTMGLNNIYVRSFQPAQLLDNGESAQCWDILDFKQKNSGNRQGVARWIIKSPVTIYGFAIWWRLTVIPGIDLSIGPAEPKTHWEQLYFPAESPLILSTSDVLEIQISSQSSYKFGTTIQWIIKSVHGDKIKDQQTLSLEKGYLA